MTDHKDTVHSPLHLHFVDDQLVLQATWIHRHTQSQCIHGRMQHQVIAAAVHDLALHSADNRVKESLT